MPNTTNGTLEAVIVNTAGGMAGGDRFSVEIVAGDGTDVVAGTAAAEKVYRAIGADTEVTTRLSVGAGAKLAWLPQEMILFDRARLNRRIDIDLAADASLLLCEAVVFGRAAMGETVEQGALIDRWRLHRDGKLVFAENVRLDGASHRNPLAIGICERVVPRSLRYWSLPAMKRLAPPCVNASRCSQAKSACRPGTASRSRGSAPAMARLCDVTSSQCWQRSSVPSCRASG